MGITPFTWRAPLAADNLDTRAGGEVYVGSISCGGAFSWPAGRHAMTTTSVN